MKIMNFNDPQNKWDLNILTEICNKVTEYADSHGLENVELVEIEDNTWSDTKNKRYDITIGYVDGVASLPIRQKLLMLKGEILDGIAFHKRFAEFY